MKSLLLIILLLSGSLFAKLPDSLLSASNANSILFKELKTYMFLVLSKSQVFQISKNCKLIKYSKPGQSHANRDLKFCLNTKIQEEKIQQTLLIHSRDQFAGTFRFNQEGKGISPLSLEQFMNFQIPAPELGQKNDFHFDHFAVTINNDRRQSPYNFGLFLIEKNFRLNIFEDIKLSSHFRNYLLDCDDCNGVPLLKVQVEGERLRYFSGHEVSEVTPIHFNQMVGDIMIKAIDQIGNILLEQLTTELDWPVL